MADDLAPAAKKAKLDQSGAEDDKQGVAASSGYDFATKMRLYYEWLFPCKEMCTWLAYGSDSGHLLADKSSFQRREFCFTLDGDIFVRYQSFKDEKELKDALVRKIPAKIDIGPVYNVDPQRRGAYTGLSNDKVFAPVERELVFDIDLTDYDDVRHCCKEGQICAKCWPLMSVAVQVLDSGLRQDFGFEHVLWVFSGRRGVHCWVCDARARQMTDEQRSSIAAFFSIYKGQEKGLSKLGLTDHDHPSVAHAYELLLETWEGEDGLLEKQGFLETEERWESILAFIPSEDIRAKLRASWRAGQMGDGVNATRWEQLKKELDDKSPAVAKALKKAQKNIVFAHAYPRLDVEVSKKMNHLLKAPFCVHPKTDKVCIPIDPAKADAFDPDGVPKLAELLSELESAGKVAVEGWRRTSLADHVELFKQCFLQSLTESVAADFKTRANEVRMVAAATSMAW